MAVLWDVPCSFPYLSHEKLEVYKKKINSSHEPVVSEMGPEARGLANGITKLQLIDKMLNNCDYSLIQTASLWNKRETLDFMQPQTSE